MATHEQTDRVRIMVKKHETNTFSGVVTTAAEAREIFDHFSNLPGYSVAYIN